MPYRAPFAWPRRPHQRVALAPFPPYNEHLVHDIGAFQLGLGACLLAGLLSSDALLAVLTGNALGAHAHSLSHLLDRHLGDRGSDPFAIGAYGLLLTAMAVARYRAADRASTPMPVRAGAR